MLRCDGIRIHPGHAAGQGNQLGLWSAPPQPPAASQAWGGKSQIGESRVSRMCGLPLARLTNGPAETSDAEIHTA